MSYADAVRFLEHATWGPTPADIVHLQSIGMTAWLNEQFAMPESEWPLALSLDEDAYRIQDEFFGLAMNGPDQLRQRVAFALSQIFVVSALKDDNYEAMRTYIQCLQDNAFGTYRNLLGAMTLNPAMGWYLDMADNDKANPALGTAANENYARESMQLFSIGLAQLNLDGTPVTGAAPTYDASTVTDLAKVFTGWTYPAIPDTLGEWTNPLYFGGPMQGFPDHHDETHKQLTFAGQAPCVITGNALQTADLQLALDCIANHPNIAPFISYRLIQRLVKSNPSPAYVQAVAQVFNSTNGSLQAVVQAILTHPEALAASGAVKLREPVLLATTLMRELNAQVSGTPLKGMSDQVQNMGQQVFYAPSVFNYFSPFFRINGVVAPEFQGLNASSSVARMNFAYQTINNQVSNYLTVDLSAWDVIAGTDTNSLVQLLNQTLYHGAMDPALVTQLETVAHNALKEAFDYDYTVLTTAFFAAAAPHYQVQQ
jgi:uncharacterized protein (DUF1800 family)